MTLGSGQGPLARRHSRRSRSATRSYPDHSPFSSLYRRRRGLSTGWVVSGRCPLLWSWASGAHLSMACSAAGQGGIGGRLRGLKSKRAVRRPDEAEPPGAGAKGWLLVSMCQIASVSFRATSIERPWRHAGGPAGACCAGSAHGKPGGAGRAWWLRASPSAGTSVPAWSPGRGCRGPRTGRRAGTGRCSRTASWSTGSERYRRSRRRS